MSSVELRVPLGLGSELRTLVSRPSRHEPVAFCLVSEDIVDARRILLVREIHGLPDDAYFDDGVHGGSWRGGAMLPIITRAMDANLGILLVHEHDFPGRACLSHRDLANGHRLVRMFQARVPQRTHGSVVLGRGSASALLATPGDAPAVREVVHVAWLGSAIERWCELPAGDGDDDVFDRQALIVGEQGLVASARVAVVGLCGGGSHVVQQLAHAGLGTIVGIDADVCERTNQHRQVGMRPAAGDVGALKTSVMSRLVETIGSGSNFVAVNARVPEPAALEALRSVDVIVGCVDNLQARADLQEIAWRFLIPYVDVGVSVRALAGTAFDPRVVVGGNVHVFIPGGFCAWCCGFISDEKLRSERGGHEQPSYFQNKRGEAQVVSFNGSVASQAVSEVLQLLTGFRGSSIDPAQLLMAGGRQRGVLKFDGLKGTVDDWGGARRDGCGMCDASLAAGRVLWIAAA